MKSWKKLNTNSRLLLIFFGLLFFYIIVIVPINTNTNSDNNKTEKNIIDEKENSENKPMIDSWDGVAYTIKDYLDKNLKDPKSLDIIECSKLNQSSKRKAFIQRVKYRAKNSFGGYSIANKIFYLIPDTDNEVNIYDWKVKTVVDYETINN